MEIKFDISDLFTNRENYQEKLHRVNLRSPLLRIHYYQNKRLQVKESQVPYQPTVEPLLQCPIGLIL